MKTLAMIMIAGFVLLPVAQADEGDVTLTLSIGSYHENRTYSHNGKEHDYNEDNPGIGFAYGVNENTDFVSGIFKNSYSKTSVYAGVNLKEPFSVTENFTVSPGIILGGVTGYDDTPQNSPFIGPMVLPNVVLAVDRYQALVGYIPKISDNTSEVFVLIVGYKF